ncbi:MAG: DUF2750 domain-containing protein [Vibrio sp.]
MSQPVENQDLSAVMRQDAQARFDYSLKQMAAQRQIWILIDESGCVMLNTDDEDCVPVWPHEELAQAWATGEWGDCQAKSISLNLWKSRWTYGLTDDDLSIVVCPSLDGEGVIVFPDEFEHQLSRQR